MKKALRKAATHLAIKAPGLTAESKAYEVWLAFEAALALHNAGAIVQPRNHHDSATNIFYVRGGPGNIPYIHLAASDAPCHFLIVWKGGQLELHISLNHQPILRNNRHELDVSIVQRAFAHAARHDPKTRPYGGPRFIGVELKAYQAEKTLDKNIARSLIGLALDLDPGAVAPTVEFKTRSGDILVSGAFRSPQYFLLTTAQLRPSSERLLATYGIKHGAEIHPNSPAAQIAINDIVAAVETRLETT